MLYGKGKYSNEHNFNRIRRCLHRPFHTYPSLGASVDIMVFCEDQAKFTHAAELIIRHPLFPLITVLSEFFTLRPNGLLNNSLG